SAPSPVTSGSDVIYTIALRNRQPTQALNVVLTDTLPAGLTLVTCSADHGGQCLGASSGATVQFDALGGGETAIITIRANVTCADGNGSVLLNTIAATTTTLDSDPSNNGTTVAITVQNPPPVIAGATPTPARLWPPDHKMVPVSIAYSATDNCG